jgi:L-arabinose isomerase
MMNEPSIGLLPLYLELYDRKLPASRARMEAFCRDVAGAFGKRGIHVTTAPVCRLKSEFARAVQAFEAAGVDAVVTLHLAYSPSLESAAVLAGTHLPLIVLDTTPAHAFGPDQDPAEIMYNHGIHGVQDLCNLLIRNGKPFVIEAGHWTQSDVVDRVIGHLPAARMAVRLATARVGLIGKPFVGMGDFSVTPARLRATIGAEVVVARPESLRKLVKQTGADEVRRELTNDAGRFDLRNLDGVAHERSVRTGLALRRWISEQRLTALSMNFEAAGKASGLPVMPFLELSKAMARGTGYAGEGDVLTAALVGALASTYPATTFTEMFCADWKGGRVFLSHMGEFNVDLADGKAVLAEPGFNFTPGESPVVPYGRLQGGAAVFVNLAPLPGNAFRLILAPGRMESVRGKDGFQKSVRGWFRPKLSVADFLTAYSRLGGTHHAALVYGADLEALRTFAEFSRLEVKVVA